MNENKEIKEIEQIPMEFITTACNRPSVLNVTYDLFTKRLKNIDFKKSTLYINIDPIVAAEKVLKATDLRFKCFDRLETISETGYLLHTEIIEIIPVDLNNDGEKESIVVNEKNEKRKVYDDNDAIEQNK